MVMAEHSTEKGQNVTPCECRACMTPLERASARTRRLAERIEAAPVLRFPPGKTNP